MESGATGDFRLAAETLLVPAHGALERIHGPGAAALLAGLDVDGEVDLAAGHGGELGGEGGEVPAEGRSARGLRAVVGLRPGGGGEEDEEGEASDPSHGFRRGF